MAVFHGLASKQHYGKAIANVHKAEKLPVLRLRTSLKTKDIIIILRQNISISVVQKGLGLVAWPRYQPT